MKNTTTHNQNINEELLAEVLKEKWLMKINCNEPDIKVAEHVKTVYPFPIRSWDEQCQLMENLPC